MYIIYRTIRSFFFNYVHKNPQSSDNFIWVVDKDYT